MSGFFDDCKKFEGRTSEIRWSLLYDRLVNVLREKFGEVAVDTTFKILGTNVDQTQSSVFVIGLFHAPSTSWI